MKFQAQNVSIYILISGRPSRHTAAKLLLCLGFPQPWLVPHWKTPPQHEATTSMLHHWDGIRQLMKSAWLELWPNSILVSSHQFILAILRVVYLLFCKLCLLLRRGLPFGQSAIKPWLVECCSDGRLSGRFSYLQTGSLELSQSDHRVVGHLSHQSPEFCVALPQICASTQSCLYALHAVPSTSWLGFCSGMHAQLWDLI